MRLNKYIARAGVCSRRRADELTANGNVKINGNLVTSPGVDVGERDIVEVNGRVIAPPKKFVYILLNKPKGYITTVRDDRGRPTVMELTQDIDERVFPVGRLDADTTGLLIMTNDGDFAQTVAHPGHEVHKTYRARVAGVISKEKLAKLRRGVELDGRLTAPAYAELVRQSHSNAVVDISIREGRNRQVRKMFAAVGSKVIDLQRTAIGEILLGGLKTGHWRKLSKAEIDSLLGNKGE
ncbi:MAG: rRNA pseudouridine synthase [Clostridiales Family XIII bacterium]|jgi:23S rRNA pseudouridine2605 synthase|nr:rRNA pseudouridine synthase [Clostridiales Family XIII bacterium]